MVLTIFTHTFSNEAVILIPKSTWLNGFLKAGKGMGLLVVTSVLFSNYKKIKDKINPIKNLLE